jgi:hypothetical protein
VVKEGLEWLVLRMEALVLMARIRYIASALFLGYILSLIRKQYVEVTCYMVRLHEYIQERGGATYTDTDEPAGAPKIPSRNIPMPCI